MAEVDNQTPYLVEVVPLIDKGGQNVAVVIAKGTYVLGTNGILTIAEEQEKISFVDEYLGDPGESEIRFPSDLVDYKPGTDLIIVQPSNFPKSSGLFGKKISIQVGSFSKSVRIRNKWKFGPLRRDKKPRINFAGTYDDTWIRNRMPLLPVDFDPRHNQVAPQDQIIPGYLKGDEHLKLTNVYKDGVVEFDLPGRMVVVAGNVMSEYFTEVASLDTLLIWPDSAKITLIWRYSIHCHQKLAMVCNIFVYLIRRKTAIELYGAA